MTVVWRVVGHVRKDPEELVGRLEMKRDGSVAWGSVCDASVTERTVQLFCKEFGYTELELHICGQI